MSERLDASKYDETGLVSKLSALRPCVRALFACACAERLIPAYRWFCLVTGYGDYCLIRESLNAAWAAASGETATEFDSLREKVIGAVPHADDSHMFVASAIAQNAVASIAYAMEVCLTGDVQTSAWAARQLYDAADSLVQQGSAVQTYIAEIEREPPVRIMLGGIAAALSDASSSDTANLRVRAEEDGEKFLAILTAQD